MAFPFLGVYLTTPCLIALFLLLLKHVNFTFWGQFLVISQKDSIFANTTKQMRLEINAFQFF